MKKLLLVASLLVVFTACKKQQNSEEVDNTTPKMINLGTGVSVGTKSAILTELTGFEEGAKIGVTAVFSDDPLKSASGSDQPDWTKKLLFQDQPAVAEAGELKTSVWVNPFAWETPQYYKQGNWIFLFAYYPYEDTNVEYIKNSKTDADDSGSTNDEIAVTLTGETITSESDDIKQPDIMIATHTKAVNNVDPKKWVGSINRNSTDAETQLKFRHMLAQLKFVINRKSNVSENATFKSLEIKMPKFGRFPIGSDDALTLYTSTGTKESSSSKLSATTDFVTYSISYTPTDGVAPIPAEKDDEGEVIEPQDILAYTALAEDSRALLVFPLSLDLLKEYCEMELTIDFNEDGYGTKTFAIKGAAFQKAFLQGKINTIKFTVDYVEVKLTAVVTPWGTGNELEIPLE